jgi:hypothetical protein
VSNELESLVGAARADFDAAATAAALEDAKAQIGRAHV